MTLAEQIAALCEQHDLSSLSISYYADGAAKGFTAYAHGGGVGAGSNTYGDVPLSDTIGSALAQLAVKRGQRVDVPELMAA